MAAARHDKSVSGSVDLAVEGARDGVPVTYSLDDLVAGDVSDSKMDFSFRYFQNMERELQLPNGFVPDRVMVEVNPKGRSAKVIRQAFEWTVQST